MLKKANNKFLTAVVANERGEVFELKGYAAVGMAGPIQKPLTVHETMALPHGSELMRLPDRKPLVFNLKKGQIATATDNPNARGEKIFPVAAFNSPGYMISYVSAFEEEPQAGYLPLFSYGAVGWHNGKFRSAVLRVDRERRQDLRLMAPEKVGAGIQRMKKAMPSNRLRRHLEKCALVYGCPAAKNFFLGRFEAPLPTSGRCNAKCLGCLSSQKSGNISICQERIGFTPTPGEISEVAFAHFRRVKKGIVSFGQGCEGDPLLAADVIEAAIRQIRAVTCQGTIHMNTNGSRPDVLEALFRAGLDSVRISLNSVREACYRRYFQPRGYRFADVVRSVDMAKQRGKIVCINYLNCPGFTDTPEEIDALMDFLNKHSVDQIQWRNLNFDALRYWNIMNNVTGHSVPIGMQALFRRIQKTFPKIKNGYFNPPKEAFEADIRKSL